MTESAPVLLSLGGALAAFGLILAVYQLRNPKWDLVLQIRPKWQRRMFWILGFVALVLTFARAVAAEISFSSLPSPLDTPLTYELAASILFVVSPVSLIYFATQTEELFSEKRARRFYEVLVVGISRGAEETINAVVEILIDNFDEVCAATKQHSSESEVYQSAIAILDVILSDRSVVRVLTTTRLQGLRKMLALVEKHGVTQREAGIGVPKLVQNLFADEDSFFYDQLASEGLALSSNIYEQTFRSEALLKNFNLFGYPTLTVQQRRELTSTGVAVYIHALSLAIETYWTTGNVPPRRINDGLSYLSDICGDLCLQIHTEERKGSDVKYSMKDEWDTLRKIVRFLGRDYVFLGDEVEMSEEVRNRERDVNEVDFFSDSAINEGIAGALYKCLEQLSYIESTTDIYHLVLELLHGIMHAGDRKEGYRDPFEKRVWRQIGENVVKRYYPAVLKSYLVFLGYCLAAEKDTEDDWIGRQTERMRRLLYVDLKPLLDEEAEMVNDLPMKDALLPESMDYKDGTFTYTPRMGRGDEEVIAPPAEDAGSALNDVDLEGVPVML